MEPFPVPRITTSRETSFYLDVRHWLGLAGHAYLRANETASADDLALHLEQLVFDHGEQWIANTASRYRIGFYDIEALASSAAEWAVETFRPGFRPRFTKADAAKGGRASKRTAEFTLDGLEGLSIREQADALGVSTRTVERYRQKLKSQPDPDQIILDQLDADVLEHEGNWREQVDAAWAQLGLVRMSDGTLYFPIPEPMTLEEVLA